MAYRVNVVFVAQILVYLEKPLITVTLVYHYQFWTVMQTQKRSENNYGFLLLPALYVLVSLFISYSLYDVCV